MEELKSTSVRPADDPDGVKFPKQKALAFGSAFLVHDDLIVTAGHNLWDKKTILGTARANSSLFSITGTPVLLRIRPSPSMSQSSSYLESLSK
jgi:hypothetical protein